MSKAGRQITRTVVLFLIVHVIAWGLTGVWRVTLATNDPPKWAMSPRSGVVRFVVFNAAGAGYADLIIWLSFPLVRRKYVDPVLLRLTEATGVGEKRLADLRLSDANFDEDEDEDEDEMALGPKSDDM